MILIDKPRRLSTDIDIIVDPDFNIKNLYISFEYALNYYGLIPEYVTLYTSAVYNKKNNKIYRLKDISFEYRSIPNDVFHKIHFIFLIYLNKIV